MMWPFLLAQSIVFFLFFQPTLVSIRIVRYLLFVVALIFLFTTFIFGSLDPFVWLLYSVGLGLTYQSARKTLRWVTMTQQDAKSELAHIKQESDSTRSLIYDSEKRLKGLQDNIRNMSNIYDRVKEMSSALSILDVFVNLSEGIIDNFSIKKIRLLLLTGKPGQKKKIDQVYQIDEKYKEFSHKDKSLLSGDVIFRGEVFPFDVRLVDLMEAEPVIRTYWDNSEMEPSASMSKSPQSHNSLVALPIKTNQGLEAILTLEGIKEEELSRIQILVDRFVYEFDRIQLYENVQKLAITDWMTGAYVRRYFFKRLDEELNRSKRFNLKFSFLMIDIDNFKMINDRYGHIVGDGVLKHIAKLIMSTVRGVDLVGRYGGEEFAAILLDTDEKAAMYVAERIRRSVEDDAFRIYDLELHCTVSVGLATYNSSIREAGEIVDWADSALYQAKRQGKNRVCAYLQQ